MKQLRRWKRRLSRRWLVAFSRRIAGVELAALGVVSLVVVVYMAVQSPAEPEQVAAAPARTFEALTAERFVSDRAENAGHAASVLQRFLFSAALGGCFVVSAVMAAAAFGGARKREFLRRSPTRHPKIPSDRKPVAVSGESTEDEPKKRRRKETASGKPASTSERSMEAEPKRRRKEAAAGNPVARDDYDDDRFAGMW